MCLAVSASARQLIEWLVNHTSRAHALSQGPSVPRARMVNSGYHMLPIPPCGRPSPLRICSRRRSASTHISVGSTLRESIRT